MWNLSPWELLERGGPILWLLLVFSWIGLALILDRLFAFAWAYQNLPNFAARLRAIFREEAWSDVQRLCARDRPLDRIARAFVKTRQLSKQERTDIVQREGSVALGRLETRLRWLAIVGQMSPMLGLLGTVTGLVSAFHEVDRLGGQVQASHLASGIWEALLTTVVGLMVAVPCLIVYHLLEGRADKIARQMSILASYLEEWLPNQDSNIAEGPISDSHVMRAN